MVVSEITLYNVLKNKLGETEAQSVVEGIKQTVREEFENKKDILLTKQDKVELIEKMNSDKQDILKWLFGFWITILLMFISNVIIKR
jgi:hypothetical protein